MCRACATGELYTQLTQALQLPSATGPIFLTGKLMLRDVWWVDKQGFQGYGADSEVQAASDLLPPLGSSG